ncbi:hypothetical protein KSP40_PGU015707 [Platanthera guangdongensis]|uniref:Uncharacterized protein n=1 Tax=Platanthera guangdongensis TaxID=2320717 RepID=A0ABR2LX61_9ASPA
MNNERERSIREEKVSRSSGAVRTARQAEARARGELLPLINVDRAVMICSCILAFALNYSIFLNTTLNSAVTQTICGNLKDLFTITLGWLLFGGLPLIWRKIGSRVQKFSRTGSYLVNLNPLHPGDVRCWDAKCLGKEKIFGPGPNGIRELGSGTNEMHGLRLFLWIPRLDDLDLTRSQRRERYLTPANPGRPVAGEPEDAGRRGGAPVKKFACGANFFTGSSGAADAGSPATGRAEPRR